MCYMYYYSCDNEDEGVLGSCKYSNTRQYVCQDKTLKNVPITEKAGMLVSDVRR